MAETFIRLNNMFVVKKGKDYYVTTISDVSTWKEMTKKQKNRTIGKKVTSIIRLLLRTHKPKHNINFRTTPTKKKIKRNLRKKVKAGG